MVTIEQVKNGLTKYVDEEILPGMTGGKRFALGVYAALAVQNLEQTVMKYKDSPAVAALNVIDSGNNVDLDRLYDAAAASMAGMEKFSVDIPLLGVLTLNRTDIDALYQMIREASK